MNKTISDELITEILNTWPGIWFITPPDGSRLLQVSQNFYEGYETEHDDWVAFEPETLPDGNLIHWLIRTAPLTKDQAAKVRSTSSSSHYLRLDNDL